MTGPALMREVFGREEFAGYTHFFYGGKQGVAGELAANMLRQFPLARIAGTYTPPFRELTEAEESGLIATISEHKPDIIWVGISTPRQELFMHRACSTPGHPADVRRRSGIRLSYGPNQGMRSVDQMRGV